VFLRSKSKKPLDPSIQGLLILWGMIAKKAFEKRAAVRALSMGEFHKQLKEVIKLDQFALSLAFFDRGLYKSVPFLRQHLIQIVRNCVLDVINLLLNPHLFHIADRLTINVLYHLFLFLVIFRPISDVFE
jgi:hypothetical protein